MELEHYTALEIWKHGREQSRHRCQGSRWSEPSHSSGLQKETIKHETRCLHSRCGRLNISSDCHQHLLQTGENILVLKGNKSKKNIFMWDLYFYYLENICYSFPAVKLKWLKWSLCEVCTSASTISKGKHFLAFSSYKSPIEMIVIHIKYERQLISEKINIYSNIFEYLFK